MEHSVVVIICMLILSAFFSGMEIAYVSSNKVHLAIEKKHEFVKTSRSVFKIL